MMERSLPAHAGAPLVDLKLDIYSYAVKIANQGSLVLTMAHLYRG